MEAVLEGGLIVAAVVAAVCLFGLIDEKVEKITGETISDHFWRIVNALIFGGGMLLFGGFLVSLGAERNKTLLVVPGIIIMIVGAFVAWAMISRK